MAKWVPAVCCCQKGLEVPARLPHETGRVSGAAAGFQPVPAPVLGTKSAPGKQNPQRMEKWDFTHRKPCLLNGPLTAKINSN